MKKEINFEDKNKLENILKTNKELMLLLDVLEKINLPQWYVVAGSIYQTVFNFNHKYNYNYGINDYDIFYFDEDTSYDAEDVIIKKVENEVHKIIPNIKLDIKNQARVHIWKKENYGRDTKPYSSTENAISRLGATINCIGIKKKENLINIFAPYGLSDIFNMQIEPTKLDMPYWFYMKKANSLKERWPLIKINDQEY